MSRYVSFRSQALLAVSRESNQAVIKRAWMMAHLRKCASQVWYWCFTHSFRKGASFDEHHLNATLDNHRSTSATCTYLTPCPGPVSLSKENIMHFVAQKDSHFKRWTVPHLSTTRRDDVHPWSSTVKKVLRDVFNVFKALTPNPTSTWSRTTCRMCWLHRSRSLQQLYKENF